MSESSTQTQIGHQKSQKDTDTQQEKPQQEPILLEHELEVTPLETSEDTSGLAEQELPPGTTKAHVAEPTSESQSEPPPPAEPSMSMSYLLEAIESGHQRLLQEFKEKLLYDRHKDTIIDNLHAELQKHQQGLIQKVNRPIFLGMIRLYDDICKQVEVLRQKPPEELSHERFFKILEGFADDIDILLDQQGVTSYRELPTAKFDANRQTAVKTETAPTEEQINDIAKSVLPGFEQGAEILKKERVEVYIKPK